MDVGFVGLGAMGRPMAHNLIAAGHQLTVHNRSPGPARAFEGTGARIAQSPAEACGGEIVITMLADDESVESVVLGPGGIAEQMTPGAIHICMATISPDLAKRLEATHEARGQAYISAPVLGLPEAAAAAQVFMLVAGAQAATQRCQPLFDAMGKQTFVAGEQAWKANLLKICNNFMVTAAIQSMAEAFALVRKCGIDAHVFHQIINEAMFPGPITRIYGAMIAGDTYEAAGFPLSLGLKDASLTVEAGEAFGVPMPVGTIIRDKFLAGLERGYNDFDWGALGRVAADDAGLKPKG